MSQRDYIVLPDMEIISGNTFLATPNVSAKDLMKKCARAFNTTPEALVSEHKHRPICHARWSLYWALRQRFGWSYPRIGRMCARDHTSIIYGIRRIDDPDFQRRYPEVVAHAFRLATSEIGG